MADRTVHYEAAFEAYLRARGTPYVPVDEAKRALFARAKLKSFDFVVYGGAGRSNLIVDVKGRRFSSNAPRPGSMQNWVTETDVDDMTHWEHLFGDGFRGTFCFAYWIDPPIAPEPAMFEHREKWYWLWGVDLTEYRRAMRPRSAKWKTVHLRTADFRELARPFDDWL